MTPRQQAIFDWLVITRLTLIQLTYFKIYLENWEKMPLLKTRDDTFLALIADLGSCGLDDWLSQADADLSDLRREVAR